MKRQLTGRSRAGAPTAGAPRGSGIKAFPLVYPGRRSTARLSPAPCPARRIGLAFIRLMHGVRRHPWRCASAGFGPNERWKDQRCHAVNTALLSLSLGVSEIDNLTTVSF